MSLTDEERLGISTAEMVRDSLARNEAIHPPHLENWLFVLDEAISWLFSLFDSLLPPKTNEKKLSDFHRSVWLTTCRILSDSLSIRTLILAGFDIQAKAVLRSTSEYMELYVALVDDPGLSSDFVKSETPEAAQSFWKDNFRAHHIRTKIYKAWSRAFPDDPALASWFSRWGKERGSRLAALAHPSFMGGAFTILPVKSNYDLKDNWPSILGDKSDSSVETIDIYLSFLFPILLLSRDFPYNSDESFRPLQIEYDPSNELNVHVRKGRDALSSLILSLNQDANSSLYPEWDYSIWEQPKQQT